MGGRAQVHLGVMEDEVLEIDKLAGKPERKASVGKMPAGEKTVAQRAFVAALVEAAGGVLGGGEPVGHGLRIEVLRQNDPLVPAQGEPVSRSAAPPANSCLNSKG